MKLLAHSGVLFEGEESIYLADGDTDSDNSCAVRSLQVSPTIAFRQPIWSGGCPLRVDGCQTIS